MKAFYAFLKALVFVLPLILLHCKEKPDEPSLEEFTVNISLNEVGFVMINAEGRADEIVWQHVFGGTGTITFNNLDISESFVFDVEAIELTSTNFTIPQGSYNIFLGLSSSNDAEHYLPITASVSNYVIDSNEEIELQADTDFGLILLSVTHVENSVVPVFLVAGTSYDMILSDGGEYYFIYVKGGVTGELSVVENIYGQTLTQTVDVMANNIYGFDLQLVESEVGGISIAIEDFTINQQVIGFSPPEGAPNFILLITDDQRFDALGYAQFQEERISRFPWLTMPTLDSLAASGTYFTNAYVTTSLCSPSRASILTGKLASNHGIVNNNTPFDQPSFVSELNKFGYYTAHFGKWHMGEQSGKRPGFDYSYSYVGQGEYLDAVFERNGEPEPTSGWVDNVTMDHAIEHLETIQSSPFCYYIGFKSAHGPWNYPPDETVNYFVGEQNVPVPSLEDTPKAVLESGSYVEPATDQRRQDLVYFQYLAGVDLNIKKLINTLREQGKLENTYLIFISDNGFFMGEHHLGDKRFAYEESIKVPVIINGPEASPIKNNDIVLNIDIAPTILDLAGVPNLLNTQGQSLVSLLNSEEVSWRDHLFYEYFYEGGIGIQSNIFAIRNDSFKLVRYQQRPEWDEFFNLTSDPYEINNVIDSSNYQGIVSEMSQLLEQNL
jgi:N-acetylglucosamine-6-sulfatase